MSKVYYKGFNKDMTCRGFQFKEGETYEEKEAKLCESGFHACEAPLDTFNYYDPSNSLFHKVELDGVSSERGDDSKVCAKSIKIGARLSIVDLVKAQFNYVKSNTTTEHTDPKIANAGDYGAANAGYKGAANAGNCGAAISGGSAAVGKKGVAVAKGVEVKAKGGANSILVVARTNMYGDVVEWKAAVVDGKKIKADTWYKLENGEFVEA